MSKLIKSAELKSREDAGSPGPVTYDARDEEVEALSIPPLNLTDHFLIAMPSMEDPVFGGAVVYLCEHSQRGAMGIVINKPMDMTIASLFERIDLDLGFKPDLKGFGRRNVLFGGPVQEDRGFVLHAPAGQYTSTMKITDEIAFTTSRDVLESMALGKGPQRAIISIGYAGWGAGQLENEIKANGWLTVPAQANIMFDVPMEERFDAAIRLLGFDRSRLALSAGHS